MAAVKTPDKTKAHTIYKTADGKRVPGVTTILSVLSKPALISWANRMGLDGIDTNKYVDEKADIGTCCHYMIQCDVNGVEPDLSGYSPNNVKQADNGFQKWLAWKSVHSFELIMSEHQMVSEEHRFGGTLDLYGTVDGVLSLVDIKTSGSGIYSDMKHQVAGGYGLLLKEHGHEVHSMRILRVGRDEGEGFEEAMIGHIAEHQELFLLCRRLYELKKIAK